MLEYVLVGCGVAQVDQADIDRVLAAVSVSAVVRSAGVELAPKGRELVGLCPFHSDREPSLRVNDSKGLYKCFACGAGGDAIAFIRDAHGLGFRAALARVAELAGVMLPELHGREPTPEELERIEDHRRRATEEMERRRGQEQADLLRRQTQARRIWTVARKSERGGLVDRYFAGRGIDVETLWPHGPPESLREHAGREAAVVARLLDDRGQGCGVHRIRVAVDGDRVRKAPGPKLTRGAIGVSRLAEPADELVLTEGIETAAAVQAATGVPAWAALSTSGLIRFELPEELGALSRVIIAADRDRSLAGMVSARRLARRLARQLPRCSVVIAQPQAEHAPDLFDGRGEPRGKGVDWLDVLVAHGSAAVRRGIEAGQRLISVDEEGLPEGESRLFEAEDYVAMARQVLLDLYSTRDRRNGRWLVCEDAGRWYVRPEGRLDWMEVRKERVARQVWQQLRRYEVATKREVHRVRPTHRSVEGVMQAMAVDCGAYVDERPCWLSASFDERGEPIWGAALHDYAAADAPVHPHYAIATASGIFDAIAWARGTVRTVPLTDRWFGLGVLPHTLDLAALADAIDDDARDEGVEGAELFGSSCPRWLEFLGQISQDDERWMDGLQEWFGLLLTADTSYERIGLMTGPTRSGKGVVQTALRSMLGAGHVCSSTFQELASRWTMLYLSQHPVCIMPDASVGKYTDSVMCAERLKSISGQDPVAIEMHGRGFTDVRILRTRIFIFVNELPKLPDNAGAIAARLLNWPTTISYEGREDRRLKPRIAAEGAGILMWALFGLRRLMHRGEFTECERGRAVIDEMRALNSPVYHYVAEECVQGAGHAVSCEAMYQAYTAWCEREGHSAMSQARFGAALAVAAKSRQRVRAQLPRAGRRAWCYEGIRPLVEGEIAGDAQPRLVETAEELTPYLPDSPAPDRLY